MRVRRSRVEEAAMVVFNKNRGKWMNARQVHDNISSFTDFSFHWNTRSVYTYLGGMYRKGMVERRKVGNKFEYRIGGTEEE